MKSREITILPKQPYSRFRYLFISILTNPIPPFLEFTKIFFSEKSFSEKTFGKYEK
jgi:hypothetical protein